ncbi:MAG: HAMP domain-containing histidine kinase [Bacteroidales bacterium]|nr:HAMP domain-containing histidine kinase [Bacteroidales bacterium]
MDIYLRKKRWKWILFGVAILIVSASLYYTNILVEYTRQDERKNVEIWADAIHRKADLVNFTNILFEEIKNEERKRVAILAEAQKRLNTATSNDDLNFYLDVISQNTTIPVIQTDERNNIISVRNVNFSMDTVTHLLGKLREEFTYYPPVVVNYWANKKHYLYYKDSNIFSELKNALDDLISSFFSEVVLNSASVPVIITDSTKKSVIAYGNLPENRMTDPAFVARTLEAMKSQNQPIEVNLADTGIRYIFYKDSFLLTQLKYSPFVMFGLFGIFLFIAYLLFSTARKSEQNQVWVGMAKETAHQLGTPLSSMIGWVELLKLKGLDDDTVREIEKDVYRLETITDRFSKIGAAARLEPYNIVQVIYETVSYIKSRTSPKVRFTITPDLATQIAVPINLHLFEWVIENLCKNAVDAIEGNGSIRIDVVEESKQVVIDITDTGKGIQKSRFKTIFHPGYTSKTRGWGLGLTLSKRIIDNYHAGKVFVRSSALGKGTTFRIILKK